jgi:hypothetical protein
MTDQTEPTENERLPERECIAARPLRKRVRKPSPRPPRVAPRAEQSAELEGATAPAASTNSHANGGHSDGNDPMGSAFDLLQLAGFSVRRVNAPSGELLLVT